MGKAGTPIHDYTFDHRKDGCPARRRGGRHEDIAFLDQMEFIFCHDDPCGALSYPGGSTGSIQVGLEFGAHLRHGADDNFKCNGIIGLHQNAHGLIHVESFF